MLLQGQELLTYGSFDFPTPPKMNWSLVDANAGVVRQVKDMIALRNNRNGFSHGLVGGSGKVLTITTAGTDKVAVIHRWSDSGLPSNDVVVIYNARQRVFPDFILTSMPYDGEWTVRHNGDWSAYSDLYNNSCWSSSVVKTNIVGGQGNICVPPMSMLILSRA